MLKIRLARRGKKKQPVYRILVQEHTKDPWGDYVEIVGTYNALTQPSTVELKEDRIKHWLSVGAQPSDTVHNLLVNAGLVEGKKRNVSALGKKAKDAVKKAEEEAKKAKEEAAKPKVEEAPAETPEGEATPTEEAAKEEPAKEEAPKEEEKAAE